MAHRSSTRSVAVASLAILLLGVTVATAGRAAGQGQPARDVTRFACPVDLIDSPFTDIGGNTHRVAIECLATYGVTTGTSATRYSPSVFVRRGQMATFLFRLLELQGIPMDTDDQGFTDISGHTHEQAINGIASIGVARGRSPGRFAPQDLITRGEMATFLYRVADLFGPALPVTADAFTDDNGSAHEGAIDAVAAAGIAQGTGGGRFDPNGAVTRAAMAAFIARLTDYGIERGLMVSYFIELLALAGLTAGEVVGGGAAGASGSIELVTIGMDDVVCYDLLVDDVAATSAHIHKAAAGATGADALLTISGPFAPNPDFAVSDGEVAGCVKVDPALLAALLTDPGSYYVDVHADSAPNGAVRGQLGALGSPLFAQLEGVQVVGPPGDPDGFGLVGAITTTQPDDLCYAVLTAGTDAPTSAAIHRGAAGSTGPVALPLKTPVRTPIPDFYLTSSCVGGLDPALVSALATTPGDFYASVSTAAHPEGALRGQMAKDTLQGRSAHVSGSL